MSSSCLFKFAVRCLLSPAPTLLPAQTFTRSCRSFTPSVLRPACRRNSNVAGKDAGDPATWRIRCRRFSDSRCSSRTRLVGVTAQRPDPRQAAPERICRRYVRSPPSLSPLLPLIQADPSCPFRWVGGTQMEALIELDYPSLSVFSSATYPPSASAKPTELSSLVHKWASLRPSWTNQLAYENGGAAADPAALGVGWLVAAAFADDSTKQTYLSEAEQEVNYLLNSVPKTSDGAISHRPAGEPVSLWADFISMVRQPLFFFLAFVSPNSVCFAGPSLPRLLRRRQARPLARPRSLQPNQALPFLSPHIVRLVETCRAG